MKLAHALKRLVWPARQGSSEALDNPPVVLTDHIEELEAWRRKNPGRPVKDWYRERMQGALNGGLHSTIGGNLRSGEFSKAGDSEFAALVRLGLKPTDVCVDYGCGTLRIGQHAIRYLDAGHYWGMDIAQDFLTVGRELVGALDAEKAPNLRVISPQSIAEVASKAPAFVFSYKVMQHVHPDELNEFLEHIVTIIGPSGRAFIFSKWTENETVQYKAMGWAHSLSTIEAQLRNLGVRVSSLDTRRKSVALEGGDVRDMRPVTAGILSIARG